MPTGGTRPPGPAERPAPADLGQATAYFAGSASKSGPQAAQQNQ